jgi:putative transposase
MVLQRATHAVYDTKYHVVWAPKYRKWVLGDEIRQRVGELFREIAEHHGFEIEEMEIAIGHIHIFLSFPPRYSIAKVVGMLKSISASEIFDEFPKIKKDLWKGEFWEDGYFARTVGDRVTAEEIKRYIRHHRDKKTRQLELF